MPRRALPAILVLLALATPVAGQGFGTDLLDVGEGTVRAVRARDLTGDGRPELVAFSDGPSGVLVSVFAMDEKGAFSPAPAAVLAPSEHGLVGMYHLGLARLAADAPHEVVCVTRKGVWACGLAPGEQAPGALVFRKPGRLADAPELPFLPEERTARVLDCAVDLDGDGAEELLLPATDGYAILRPSRGPERKPDFVRWRTETSLTTPAHRFMTLRFDLPRAVVADMNGDGRPDLVGAGRGRLHVALQREDGSFEDASRPLAVLEPAPAGGERSDLTLGDVDGDGRADLLLAQSPASVEVLERFSSRQSLFLSPKLFSSEKPGRLAEPAMSFKTPGISVNPTLVDFDADGDLDLILTSLEFDMTDRMLKKVTADYLLFLFDLEKRAFEREPYFKVKLRFPADRLERSVIDPVCFFGGDFDGDGKRDLLNVADDGHVTIRQGTTDTGFLSPNRYSFKREIFRAQAVVSSDVLVTDLNLDGASDAVAHRESRVYVIRSVR